MSGKTVPLSVRVSDDDAVFLASLEIEDAVTPSEKLRAILQDTRRRHIGLKDASEGGLLMREMATPARRNVRRLEGRLKKKSDLVLKLYERVPDIMARLIAGPETGDDPENVIQFERELSDQIAVLLKDFIALGITSPVRVYAQDSFRDEMKPVIELVELLRHHQKIHKGERNE